MAQVFLNIIHGMINFEEMEFLETLKERRNLGTRDIGIKATAATVDPVRARKAIMIMGY